MKKWLLLILCAGWAGLIYFGYMIVSSVQTVDLQKQSEQLERTMQLLDYKKTDAASKQIYRFFEQFPDEAFKTEDEKMMFHHIEMDTKHTFVFQIDQLEDLTQKLYKLYLFVDLLQDENAPLWRTEVKKIQQGLTTLIHGEKNFTETQWKALRLKYEQIYPCLYISTSAGQLQRMNKKMENLDFYVWNHRTNDSYKNEMADLQEDFSYLLKENVKDGMDISFYLIFFFTGGTILSTLSYVAARKYLAQKKSKKHSVRSKIL